MAWVSDADQSGFPVPGLDSGGSACFGPGTFPGPGTTRWDERYPGVAELLLQVADDGSRPLSRTRPIYSVDEAEKYFAMDDGRGFDYAPRAGVLRLTQASSHATRQIVMLSIHFFDGAK